MGADTLGLGYRCIVFDYKDFHEIVSKVFPDVKQAVDFGESFDKGARYELVKILLTT